MELATGRFPFPPEGQAPLPSVLDLLRYIEEEAAPTLSVYGDRFSKEFINFINLCLIKDPDLRPNPANLLKEAFCVKAEKEGGVELMSIWAMSVLLKMGK
jgi:serine/threonine protein kinase